MFFPLGLRGLPSLVLWLKESIRESVKLSYGWWFHVVWLMSTPVWHWWIISRSTEEQKYRKVLSPPSQAALLASEFENWFTFFNFQNPRELMSPTWKDISHPRMEYQWSKLWSHLLSQAKTIAPFVTAYIRFVLHGPSGMQTRSWHSKVQRISSHRCARMKLSDKQNNSELGALVTGSRDQRECQPTFKARAWQFQLKLQSGLLSQKGKYWFFARDEIAGWQKSPALHCNNVKLLWNHSQ